MILAAKGLFGAFFAAYIKLLGRKLLYDLPRETAEIMQQAGDTTLACLYKPTQTKARQHL